MQTFRISPPLALIFFGSMLVAGYSFFGSHPLSSPVEPSVAEMLGPDTAGLERIQMKIRIADEVAAGRLNLLTAAHRFREIQESSPGGLRLLLRKYPGASEEEALCRNVITFVGGGPNREAERAAVVERLEEELRQHLAAQKQP